MHGENKCWLSLPTFFLNPSMIDKKLEEWLFYDRHHSLTVLESAMSVVTDITTKAMSHLPFWILSPVRRRHRRRTSGREKEKWTARLHVQTCPIHGLWKTFSLGFTNNTPNFSAILTVVLDISKGSANVRMCRCTLSMTCSNYQIMDALEHTKFQCYPFSLFWYMKQGCARVRVPMCPSD